MPFHPSPPPTTTPTPPPATGGSSSGSSSSSGGSSGGSGTSATTLANNSASFKALLISWGLNVDGGMANLISHAVSGKWNVSQFENALYQTPEFHQAFPGIFNRDGTMKMSPSQYIGITKQYQSSAQQAGVPLSAKNLSALFRGDVSPSEAATKFQADQKLRDNKELFAAFNEQRRFEHQKPLGVKDQLNFIIGEGNKQWYHDWNRANEVYVASQAGVAFAKAGSVMASQRTSLDASQINRISGMGESNGALQQHFKNLANTLSQVLPASQLQGFNLSKDDLVQAEFGGPKQNNINQLIAQIGKNLSAQQGNTGAVNASAGSPAGNRAGQNRPLV